MREGRVAGEIADVARATQTDIMALASMKAGESHECRAIYERCRENLALENCSHELLRDYGMLVCCWCSVLALLDSDPSASSIRPAPPRPTRLLNEITSLSDRSTGVLIIAGARVTKTDVRDRSEGEA